MKGGQRSEASLPLVASSNTGGGTPSFSPTRVGPHPASVGSTAAPGGTGGGDPTLPITGASTGPAILVGAAASVTVGMWWYPYAG